MKLLAALQRLDEIDHTSAPGLGVSLKNVAKVTYPVIPAKAGIQNSFKILDSGSRSACPE
jgi:hypothetical protein